MKNNNLGIHTIITGGTMDFQFNPNFEIEQGTVDSLVPRKQSVVPMFLKNKVKMRGDEILFDRVSLKDSRNMNEEDYQKVLDMAAKSPYEKILITTGIVEMDTFKEFLSANAEVLDGKVVGLVGSRLPLSEYRSDAGFHLGYSIGNIQNSEPGIFSFHPESTRESLENLLPDMVIHITGGTIDSSYSESADTARPYEHSRIAEYFAETLGVKLPEPELTFNEITMKDSRELTETEIRELMDQIKNNSHKNQIATAGTYALPDLASSSDKMMQSGEMQNSTVTYVGAMLPDDVIFNDGYFNLGFALGKTPHVDPGVYVAMHGWMTHPDNVMKQLQKAEFVPYDLDNRV